MTETYRERLEAARDAVEAAMDLSEQSIEQWSTLQKAYFKLEYMVRAKTPGLHYASFAPSDHGINHDGTFTDFGGVRVGDPDNPFNEHVVTIDHVVEGDGSVRVRVNGVGLDRVTSKASSHIR